MTREPGDLPEWYYFGGKYEQLLIKPSSQMVFILKKTPCSREFF